MAALKPLAFNDRWYVTAEGYHVHPASEAFTPGLQLEWARSVRDRVEVGAALLVGRAPAYLGMIDGNSLREFHGNEGMLVTVAYVSPGVRLTPGLRSFVLLAPLVGIGRLGRTDVVPDFGPTVRFGGATSAVFGGRIASCTKTPPSGGGGAASFHIGPGDQLGEYFWA